MRKIIKYKILLFYAFINIYAKDIAVVTMAIGKEYNNTVKSSIENKRRYCKRHGYDFICIKKSLDKNRPIPWSKIRLLLKILKTKKYKWLFWTDADSLIMNFNIKLEELIDNNFDFIVSGDNNTVDPKDLDLKKWKDNFFLIPNIITGEFLLKNSKWSENFLTSCYQKTEFINHNWWEQGSIIDMLSFDSKNQYWPKTKVIPFRLLNSFIKGHYAGSTFVPFIFKKGDFILHFSGKHNSKKLKYLLDKYSKMVITSKFNVSLEDYYEIHGHNPKKDITKTQEAQLFKIGSKIKLIKNCLEIGFNSGYISLALLKSFPKSNLISIGQKDYKFSEICKRYLINNFQERFTHIKNDNILSLFAKNKFDLILIHDVFEYNKCLKIIENCINNVENKTIIMIDNYHLPGINRAVLECYRKGIIEIIQFYKYKNDLGNINTWIEVRKSK